MMDIIKNCLDNFVAQQNTQSSLYDEGYKKGYAEGFAKADKNLIDAEQIMLEGMAKDWEKDHAKS